MLQPHCTTLTDYTDTSVHSRAAKGKGRAVHQRRSHQPDIIELVDLRQSRQHQRFIMKFEQAVSSCRPRIGLRTS